MARKQDGYFQNNLPCVPTDDNPFPIDQNTALQQKPLQLVP